MRNEKMNIVAIGVLMAIQLVITFEMSMVMPMAPLIASIYQIEQSNVTLLNLGYALSGLFVPFLGMLADKMGNKRILIFSSFLFVIGSALCICLVKSLGFCIRKDDSWHRIFCIDQYQPILSVHPGQIGKVWFCQRIT
jgi:MFS family permease